MSVPPATRRAVLLAVLLAVPLAFAGRARAEPALAQAAGFIRDAGQELAAVVGGATTSAEKRRRLRPFLDRVVDVEAVARFCLGRYWPAASAAQQREYVDLFHGVLLRNVVARMGDYQPVELRVVIGQPDAREDGVHVPTVVERAGNPPARIVWVVRQDGGAPRIVDVIAEGTSLRLTVRADYNAFLARHGDSIPALLDALRAQADPQGG